MDIATENLRLSLLEKLKESEAGGIPGMQRTQLLSNLDFLSRSTEGIVFIYQHLEEILASGIFKESVWEKPQELVSALVKGTLCSGYPNNVLESLSELRMLKIATGEMAQPNYPAKEAQQFLEETLVNCFDLAFSDETEELRMKLSVSERQRFRHLFEFILTKIPAENIKLKVLEEIDAISHQRPILTGHLRDLIKIADKHLDTQGETDRDERLKLFIRAASYPGTLKPENPDHYLELLANGDEEAWFYEARAFGKAMRETGIVCPYQGVFVQFVNENHPDLLPEALGVTEHGKVEIKWHLKWVQDTLSELISADNYQFIYPFSRLLNRNLLSRKPVLNALKKLKQVELHPEIAQLLREFNPLRCKLHPKEVLRLGAIYVLGQPLGLRQGNNPTCQSARGISMWSQHSPAKFLSMLIQVAVGNALEFRYGRELIRSSSSVYAADLHLDLDPVSLVMVPHLDFIYNQMMQKASIQFMHEDPHVSVNPSFYGHWIQTGFASCYKQNLNAISDYNDFIGFFYAAFHPKYNGGFKLIYPVPLGIIVTNSKAEFLGFHAVSLLRVKETDSGVRAYFYNPNNEGRQNWGQGIKPSVNGFGEKYGESSLPIDEFASRVYAFHYNSIEVENFAGRCLQIK
ncbi:MAG: hypothetical protein ACPF8V_07290 [Luteibaculum sp.]